MAPKHKLPSKEIRRHIAARIKQCRTQGRLVSLADLAKASGINIEVLKVYETGEVETSVPDLVRIAKALNVDLNYFVEGYEPMDLLVGQHINSIPEFRHLILYFAAAPEKTRMQILKMLQNSSTR